MLYTQFVVTVLRPAHDLYHVVDNLPAMTSGRISWEAVKALKLQLLRDVLAAPVRVVRTIVQSVRQSSMTPNPGDDIVYPYGARFSVRELGASERLQMLDVAKYIKMIEGEKRAARRRGSHGETPFGRAEEDRPPWQGLP